MTTFRSLTSFDPGPNIPDRWSVAWQDGIAKAAIERFVLIVDGSFVMTKPISTPAAEVRIQGDYGATITWTKPGQMGLRINGEQSRIADIELVSDDPFGAAKDVGLWVEAPRVRATNLTIRQFSGTGLYVHGDTNSGTNANDGRFHDVQVVLCGNGSAQSPSSAGVYLAGGDANANEFYTLRVNDCRRGVMDSSFIGNKYFGGGVEGCNDRFVKAPGAPVVGYGFCNDQPSATRLAIFGMYAESDSECDVNHRAQVFGAMPNRGNATVYAFGGVQPSISSSNTADGRTVVATLGGDEAGVALSLNAYGDETGALDVPRHILRYGGHPALAGWWRLNCAGVNKYDALRFRGPSMWTPNDTRHGPNGARECWGESIEEITQRGPSDEGQWRLGDRAFITAPQPGQVASAVCTALDPNGGPTWTPLTRVDACGHGGEVGEG